jgi:predicted Rossmann fold nucleotide-binding protein DprA/Smf involved in DNA uptake
VSEKTDSPKAKPEKAIRVLRERCGGVPRDRLERNKQQTADRRKLKAALESGPKTVPQLAEATGLPTQRAFWLLMGMKKYGTVAEGQEQDGYFEYMLAAESKQE